MAKGPERLLELLVCPADKSKLSLNEAADILECPLCKIRYKLREGIPVMLLAEDSDW